MSTDALAFFGTALAIGALATVRRAQKTRKYVCSGEGNDCPCHHVEGVRPPVTPAQLGSVPRTLEPGAAMWLCTCGASKSYPFCDGSHRGVNAREGTTFAPRKVANETAEKKTHYVCACGHGTPEGMCRGAHKAVRLAQA